jgi:hypothetical protein
MLTQQRRKSIAPESNKTRRAREKLREQIKKQESLITPQALADTINKIQKWIAANAAYRTSLREKKDIRLFDQNQNAATTSKRIQELEQKLKTEFFNAPEPETASLQ